MYQETGSTFTHNGAEFDLNYFLKRAQTLPTVKFKVSNLTWMGHDKKDLESDRVKKADLKYPVLVTQMKDGKWVTIDGFHRYLKAVSESVEEIDAKVVPHEWFYEKAALAKKGSLPKNWDW